MNKNFKNSIAIVVLLFSSTIVAAQGNLNPTLKVGMLTNFDAYTSDGSVTIDGTITNNVGTSLGNITGANFSATSAYNGTTYINNNITDTCKEALLRSYIHLTDIFVDEPGTHAAAFGASETIEPGVYSVGAAGSTSDTLFLDGGGNNKKHFIFKFDGALAMAAGTIMVLERGAKAENIYWIAEGAITVGANSTVVGSLIAHPGEVTIGANCDIEGRLLTTSGAITVGSGSYSSLASGAVQIPIGFSSGRPTSSRVDVLRSIDSFALFSGNGQVSNAAISGIIGNIGADGTSGAVVDFTSSTIIGTKVGVRNTITAQAKLDLDSACTDLNALISDSTITYALGNGDTMAPGVYDITGAGSLTGSITLDAGNDSDAIFVFRIGGLFTVNDQAKVILSNATRMANVYWISTAAISMGKYVYMKGTIIATGACTIAKGCNVEGRMLSKTGAVESSTGVIYKNPKYFKLANIPVKLLSFTAEAADGNVDLNWVTASELNNHYFNVEYSKDGSSFTSVIIRTGAGNSAEKISYSATHNTSEQGTIYYRLKQTDFDGTTSYSDIVAVNLSAGIDVTFKVSPNPIHNKAIITTSENLNNASLSVYNSHMMVKQVNNLSGRSFTFQREDLKTGLYWISLVQDGQVIATKKVVLTD